MFNAPRPAQRYAPSSPNNFEANFIEDNHLPASVYEDGLDPWSAEPGLNPPLRSSPLGNVIADATLPSIYHRSFALVDSENTGETSVNSLLRVLGTSSLPAATINRIVVLVSSQARVSKLEFFVALALVALAQTGKDITIEQVTVLSSQNMLPEPVLDLDQLPRTPSLVSPTVRKYQQSATNVHPPAPSYSVDPWNSNPKFNPISDISLLTEYAIDNGGNLMNGAPSAFAGTGMPKLWWKKLEKIKVKILGQQGFILNRYMVYEVSSNRGMAVPRRYSEFVFLWECLMRRYPFRLFPALPPKRLGADEQFLEQRRRGLQRALSFVVNHPIIKDDDVLAVFMEEPSFETWRKNTAVSLEEESVSKSLDRFEEMTIPSDLDDKLVVIRGKVNPLIEQWQRICLLAERIIKRREAAASDLARLTTTLRTVNELNERCWRGGECEMSNGIRGGLEQIAVCAQRQSDLAEARSQTLLDTTLETLKSQRDLYIATHDFFVRHDRLSIDHVDRLTKRINTNALKLEDVRTTQKERWQERADRLTTVIERDQATVAAQLSRRKFVRACLWHELRVVLHNRENTLLGIAMQTFAREELHFSETVTQNWSLLGQPMEAISDEWL